MKRLRLDVILLVAGIAVLLFIGYQRSAMEQPHRSIYSTYDTGPNGYEALYNVLRGAGVPLRRFERALRLLDPSVRTLVLTGYENDPAPKPLDAHDVAALHRFVQNGGRFVAFDEQFAGARDVTPGVGTTVPVRATSATALANDAYTRGVTTVRGPIDWAFPIKKLRGARLLASARGIVAVSYRYGRGEVVAITAPALFGNAQLQNADNLRFAYNAIAGHGDAVFDEYVHGYDDQLSMWAVLPAADRAALWIVLAAVVLALIGANAPFAPPFLPARADERDSSDYITAMAELMRRSRRRSPDDEVLWQATIDFQRRKEHA
jgi:Domain of unknown function (DUF4350)